MPPRSDLFSLEPIGIGTPMMECLTSYIIRLANAHRISTNLLMRFAIRNSNSRNANLVYRRYINGFGNVPLCVVEGLENLTKREDINYLGTLNWKGFIQGGILRERKAWCPHCLREWKNTQKPIYEPLLWQFNDIDTCQIHNSELQQKCSVCNNTLEIIANNAPIGTCSKCLSFLGDNTQGQIHNISNQKAGAMQCISELIVKANEIKILALFGNRRWGTVPLSTLINWYNYDNISPLESLRI